MIKYTDAQVVFREFPDEVTLAINLSLCPNNCDGCHSPYLREDIGMKLTTAELDKMIKENPGITCIGFMGGDNDTISLLSLFAYVKHKYRLKCGWYSGKDIPDNNILQSNICDYIKIGHYDKDCGPIDMETTNQRLYELVNNEYVDITYKFWKK